LVVVVVLPVVVVVLMLLLLLMLMVVMLMLVMISLQGLWAEDSFLFWSQMWVCIKAKAGIVSSAQSQVGFWPIFISLGPGMLMKRSKIWKTRESRAGGSWQWHMPYLQ
jgi:hypothetical protein